MLTNNFGKRNFMQPMGRLSIALIMGPGFFFLGAGGGVMKMLYEILKK
jgi:hypothetical protein